MPVLAVHGIGLLLGCGFDLPFACEGSFEDRCHLSSSMSIEGLDETQPPSTVHR